MKSLEYIATFFIAIGILLVAAMGVDLVQFRAGFGMASMGLGGMVLALINFKKPGGAPLTAQVWLVIFGAGYLIWRALSGGPPGLAASDVTLVLLLLSTYLLITLGSPRVTNTVIVCVGIICLAHAGVIVAQYFSGFSFFVWRENPEFKAQATGLFGHYNPFAGFLNASAFLFLTAAIYLGPKKTSLRILSGVIFVTILVCVIASNSRGGLIAFVVGFGAWMVILLVDLKTRRHRNFGTVALVGGILVILTAVLTPIMVKGIVDRRAARNSERTGIQVEGVMDDGGRIGFQQMAFEIFQDSPVIGNGPRSFSYLALSHWDPEERSPWAANPEFAHNEYLQLLAEYGAIGLLFVLIVFMAHFVSTLMALVFNAERVNSPALFLKIGALGGLLAVMSQCFFSFLMHVPACVLMVGLLLGILGRKIQVPKVISRSFSSILFSGVLLVVSGVLLAMGVNSSKSFLSIEKAKRDLASAVSSESALRAFELFSEAGRQSMDPKPLEEAGREAMGFALRADDSGEGDRAVDFRRMALKIFGEALDLNSHSSIAMTAIPQLHDALGEFEQAEAGHLRAMELLWVREPQLKVHYHAARSSFIRGIIDLKAGRNGLALNHFRHAHQRIVRRTEILKLFREKEEDMKIREDSEALISYLEGERLAIEADRIWKKARPRNPESAHGFMLEAAKRYQASEKVARSLAPLWSAQWDRLQENLKLLEMVKVVPTQLTEKDILSITQPEAVLDPTPATR